MGRQGIGIWLNLRTGKWFEVYRHEFFLYEEQDKARQLRVPTSILARVREMNPHTHENEIRLLGLEAGLVRIRDNGFEVVAQFEASRGVRKVLRAIWKAMQEIPSYRTAWHVRLENLHPAAAAGTRLSMDEFGKRLKDKNDPILIPGEEPRPIYDIPCDTEPIERIDARLDKRSQPNGETQ